MVNEIFGTNRNYLPERSAIVNSRTVLIEIGIVLGQ
jgi:hypothetical protein